MCSEQYFIVYSQQKRNKMISCQNNEIIMTNRDLMLFE